MARPPPAPPGPRSPASWTCSPSACSPAQPGTFRQTAALTKTQRDLLAKLMIAHPKKIIEAAPAAP